MKGIKFHTDMIRHYLALTEIPILTLNSIYRELAAIDAKATDPKKSKWSNVNNSLPDSFRPVLVWTDEIALGAYDERKGMWRVQALYGADYVTKGCVKYWRELPKPPE